MKSISASIVTLAGAILLAVGSHVQRSDERLFAQVVGCGLGLIGLWQWFTALKADKP